MKALISFLIVTPMVALALDSDLTLYNAQRYGAEAKFVLRVVDYRGFPVADARIFGGFQTGGNLNDSEPIRGITDASYLSSFKFVHEKHPNIKQTPFFKYVSGAEITDTRLDAYSYIVFRTRTKVDDKGNLVSAHYGKIYGLWEFFGGIRAANVQFNPNPNDTNLEDMETATRSKNKTQCREKIKTKR